jgi:hypothetical protein
MYPMLVVGSDTIARAWGLVVPPDSRNAAPARQSAEEFEEAGARPGGFRPRRDTAAEKTDPRINSRRPKIKEGIAVNRLFEQWRKPVVRGVLKLSLPAVLALGLAAAPAHAQSAADMLWNAWYGGQTTTNPISDTQSAEAAVSWGHGTFFNSSTALFWDVVDTSTDPATISKGSFMIYTTGLDLIVGEFEGVRGDADETGLAATSGTYTIDGGWGEWQDVVGSGTFTGTYDTTTGEMTIFLVGLISPPSPTSG